MDMSSKSGSNMSVDTRLLNGKDAAAGQAPEKEQAARAAMQKWMGRALNDLEWQQMRSRLLDFGLILLDWHRNNPSNALLPEAA